MRLNDVITMLRRECEQAGSARAWALRHEIHPVYVGNVLAGRREPGPKMLSALGLERRIVYERKRVGD